MTPVDAGGGRDMLGPSGTLAVERFRERLLGGARIPEGRGRRALDFGCGDGFGAVALLRRGWRVDAYDIEPHPFWPVLRKRFGERLRLKVLPANALARLGGAYGLVLEKDVLHHVPDPVDTLRALKALTAPGGEMWVIECNRLNPVSYLHLTLLRGHQHFTARRLRDLAAEAGLLGAYLTPREARVYPVESITFQDAADRIQDALESMPGWGRFAVYHVLRWGRPDRSPMRGGKP